MAEDSSNAFASALARARQVDFYASFFKSTFRYVIYDCVSYVFLSAPCLPGTWSMFQGDGH